DSDASSDVLNMYVDLNGDRYPDIVSSGIIQYTNMLGALSSNTLLNNGFVAGDDSKDSTVGATIPSMKPSSTDSSNEESSGNKTDTNVSSGINVNSGNSFNSRQWVDINGDGLPDKVRLTNTEILVSLNLGY